MVKNSLIFFSVILAFLFLLFVGYGWAAAQCIDKSVSIDTDTCHSCSWFINGAPWSPTDGWRWVDESKHSSIPESGYYNCDDRDECDEISKNYSTELCNYRECLTNNGCTNGDVCSGGTCVCSPSTEVCDGIDNDCNGLIDEQLYDSTGCNQKGACLGATKMCVGGVWASQCSIQPATEICSIDGAGNTENIDEDCDGLINEGLLNACGECGSIPTETCNGFDDDCDGSIDETFECVQSSLLCECLPDIDECTDAQKTCVPFCDSSCNTIQSNEPPSAVIDGPYLNYVNIEFDISGTCTDGDDGISACNWVNPAGCTISNITKNTSVIDLNSGIEVTEIFGDMECSSSGSYVLSLTATDLSAVSITTDSSVTIQAWDDDYFRVFNTAPEVPVISLAKSGDIVGSTLICTASSTDPDTEFVGGQTLWYEYEFYKDDVKIDGINFLLNNYQTSTTGGEGKYKCLAAACDGIVCVPSELSNEVLICPTYYKIETATVGGIEVQACVQDPDTGTVNTFVCAPKPENSLWNIVASYVQRRASQSDPWVPSESITEYNETPASEICRFICDAGNCYEWNSSTLTCERNESDPACQTREASCQPALPSNAVWTIGGTYEQDYDSVAGEWVPDDIVTEYADTEAKEVQPCHYLCEQGFTYENGECVILDTYCELVGMNFTIKSAKINGDNIDLNFEISCENPTIMADLPTQLNYLDVRTVRSESIDRYDMSNTCSKTGLDVQRTLNIAEQATYIAEIHFGNAQHNCFEELSFSAIEFIDSDGDGIPDGGSATVQGIPDNNIFVVIVLLMSMSFILLKKKK